jgi:AcrR family transcriptional regulator
VASESSGRTRPGGSESSSSCRSSPPRAAPRGGHPCIVEAAIELLDAAGEGGLTFRVLTERLATGPGAIYWHVANKGELLAAATDAVVAAALAVEPAESPDSSPQDRIRAVALGLFDAIDEHPWVAAQLSASSWQATAPRILETIGRQVRALGVPEESWFTVTSVLMQYILGAAGQNAANARVLEPGADRGEYLGAVSRAWAELDPDDYSFTRTVADQMREHDDRAEFLAGITLVLAGIAAVHPAGRIDL